MVIGCKENMGLGVPLTLILEGPLLLLTVLELPLIQ